MALLKYEKDKVSICIPTYNGEKFIKQTLDSVLSQDYRNIEIIVNDDCSSDHTLDIVKKIKDPRIKIYTNEENLGLVGNWNKTVSYAAGEFVKLMCQDDILCERAISNQVRLLQQNPGAALSIGNTYVIDSAGRIVMDRKRFKKDVLLNGKKYAMKSFRGRNIYSEPPNVLYRTENFYRLGQYDTELSYTPDWDFGVKLSYLGDVACSKNYIMKFRVSDCSETNRLYTKRIRSSIQDSDLLIKKHQKLGKIKINVLDIVVFKLIIRVAAVARLLFLNKNNGKKRIHRGESI